MSEENKENQEQGSENEAPMGFHQEAPRVEKKDSAFKKMMKRKSQQAKAASSGPEGKKVRNRVIALGMLGVLLASGYFFVSYIFSKPSLDDETTVTFETTDSLQQNQEKFDATGSFGLTAKEGIEKDASDASQNQYDLYQKSIQNEVAAGSNATADASETAAQETLGITSAPTLEVTEATKEEVKEEKKEVKVEEVKPARPKIIVEQAPVKPKVLAKTKPKSKGKATAKKQLTGSKNNSKDRYEEVDTGTEVLRRDLEDKKKPVQKGPPKDINDYPITDDTIQFKFKQSKREQNVNEDFKRVFREAKFAPTRPSVRKALPSLSTNTGNTDLSNIIVRRTQIACANVRELVIFTTSMTQLPFECIVQNNIMGKQGLKVLIKKGSRVYGFMQNVDPNNALIEFSVDRILSEEGDFIVDASKIFDFEGGAVMGNTDQQYSRRYFIPGVIGLIVSAISDKFGNKPTQNSNTPLETLTGSSSGGTKAPNAIDSVAKEIAEDAIARSKQGGVKVTLAAGQLVSVSLSNDLYFYTDQDFEVEALKYKKVIEQKEKERQQLQREKTAAGLLQKLGVN